MLPQYLQIAELCWGVCLGALHMCCMVVIVTCGGKSCHTDICFSNVNTLCMLCNGWWGLPVPKFLDWKSVRGTTLPSDDVPGCGGTSYVDFLFLFPLPGLEPVLWAGDPH